MMNGFHRGGRDISAHERTSTIGKKIANWTVGNSIWRVKATWTGRRSAARCGRVSGGMVVGRALPRLLAAGLSVGTVLCVLALLPSAGNARRQMPIAHPAGCGGVEEVYPAHHPRGRIPPLAIGDSTMLLALEDLAAGGFDANAHGCRQYPEALALLAQRKAQGRLPHMVLIALGGDGSVTHADIGETIGLLCCTRLLVIVTNRELGGGSGQDAVTEREEAAKHQ